MTALTKERTADRERWTYKQFTLASGNKAWKGGTAVGDLSTGKVEPGHNAETDLFTIGIFDETVDATAGDKLVNVRLSREIEVVWRANAGGGDAVVAADLFNLCYLEDDQTVTRTPTSRSVAGRVWALDSVRGVAVELLQAVPAPTSLDGLEGVDGDAPAFAANDSVVANNPSSGTIFDIPTTGAASTVTLPATAIEGTIIYFVADGSKNGHTVQYRDATGPTNLTTALTASKRHLVVATFLNGKWNANAYVSP